MQSRTRPELLVSIAVLVFFVGMLIWSDHIPDPRGRYFPVLVSATAVALCLLDLIAHTETSFGRSVAFVLSGTLGQSTHAGGHPLRREAVAIAWVVGATALIVIAGFLVAIPVYVFGYMMLYARRTVRDSVIAALATTVCIWVGFELLLSYDLYGGLFFSN
jgi:hypothetical protein